MGPAARMDAWCGRTVTLQLACSVLYLGKWRHFAHKACNPDDLPARNRKIIRSGKRPPRRASGTCKRGWQKQISLICSDLFSEQIRRHQSKSEQIGVCPKRTNGEIGTNLGDPFLVPYFRTSFCFLFLAKGPKPIF